MANLSGDWKKCPRLNSGKQCREWGHVHVSHRNIFGKVIWYYAASGQKQKDVTNRKSSNYGQAVLKRDGGKAMKKKWWQ